MRTVSAAAFALATGLLAGACAGGFAPQPPYSAGDANIPPVGIGTGDGGGDAGTDAGIDAGTDAGQDAGCAAQARSGLGVIDGCSAGQNALADISVSGSTCAATISLTSGTGLCTGAAHGASDAFQGGCGGYNSCSSSSLPGVIYCATGPMTSCAIAICDAGTCP
jgi:hypothetical protein